MRAAFRWIFLVGALAAYPAAHAQIYTCVDENGTRVYSSTRCGPDAQVVPNVGTRQKTAPKTTAAPKPVRKSRPESELAELIQKCDAGDVKACNEWTLGGGPNLLREKERKAELECEAGSLTACEERYCREGMDRDCRARVLRTARLAGETWYLREESYRQEDGFRRYDIRCLPDGKSVPRDITISCSTQIGPNRCYLANPEQGVDRLSAAAAKYCAQKEGQGDGRKAAKDNGKVSDQRASTTVD